MALREAIVFPCSLHPLRAVHLGVVFLTSPQLSFAVLGTLPGWFPPSPTDSPLRVVSLYAVKCEDAGTSLTPYPSLGDHPSISSLTPSPQAALFGAPSGMQPSHHHPKAG